MNQQPLHPESFLEQEVVMKNGKTGLVLKAESYPSIPNEHLLTILLEGNTIPSSFLALKGFQSGFLRFLDESLNQQLTSLLEEQTKQEQQQAEEEKKRQAEEDARREQRWKALEKARRVICIKKSPSISCSSKYHQADVTSRSSNELYRGLSPFLLGPGVTDNGETYLNFENFYQYSKVYSSYVSANGEPTYGYFVWRKKGFASPKANRHPMKGDKVLYSLFYEKGPSGEICVHCLDYIEARKKLYIPNYAKLVVKTKGYQDLKSRYDNGENIALIDFDGYDELDMVKVVNDPKKIMGHSFVIKMLLQGDIEVVNDRFIDHLGILA